MALGDGVNALSVDGVKSLLLAMNMSYGSLGMLNRGGWVVFIDTNHFLAVVHFLPNTDAPRSWPERFAPAHKRLKSQRSAITVSAFRTRGVPGPTSKLLPRAPAQMGRRETEREGGKKPVGNRREG
jgi:hypothetical protein